MSFIPMKVNFPLELMNSSDSILFFPFTNLIYLCLTIFSNQLFLSVFKKISFISLPQNELEIQRKVQIWPVL